MAKNATQFVKVWTDIRNKGWWQENSGIFRGIFLQLLIIAKDNGDSGEIFHRNFSHLAQELGVDKNTAKRNLRKLHDISQIILTEKKGFIKIEIPEYQQFQELKAHKSKKGEPQFAK